MEKPPVVILAAGEGRRLSLGKGVPKPLTKFAGLTLLERAVRMWHKFGFTKFYVVVGHAKEEVTEGAKKIAAKLGVEIIPVENNEWPMGNGTSVLAASQLIDRPFFLQMVDHVFDAKTLQEFLKKTENAEITVLAIDPRVDSVLDIEDATKVKLEGEHILDIGKSLREYDAIDMGLFFCTPEIFESLRKSREQNGGKLSDGVRWLANNRRIKAVVLSTGQWFDIDKPEILRAAEQDLFERIKKSEDGLVSKHLNRQISFRISKRLSSLLSPNPTTGIAFCVALLGALLFTSGSYLATALAGVLIQLSSILDGCDGEIARIRLEASARGAWFDTVLDRYADALISLAVTYNMWMQMRTVWVWLGGFLALFAFVGVSYIKKEFKLRTGQEVKSSVFEKLTKRDLRLFGIFVGAIAGLPYHAMLVIAFITHLWMLHFIWTEMREKFKKGQEKSF